MKSNEFNKVKPYTYFILRKSDGKKYHCQKRGGYLGTKAKVIKPVEYLGTKEKVIR